MSPKADEYRRKAKVAEALAESARDQNAKETYLEIAEQWRHLAEQAEKHDW
jgi:hypothetical protein